MSTPLAHLATGTAIYFSYSRLRSPHTVWALPCIVLLAMLPDFDYLPIWMFGIRQEPRVTHGVFFCILAGLLAWRLTLRWQATTPCARQIGLAGFILAPLSHLLLDFSVGAHALPLFWPFPNGEVMSPMALMPAVMHGRSFTNYYLWRNSLVESLVLIPMLLFFVARARAVTLRKMAGTGLVVLPFWSLCVGWSLSLST